MASDRAESGGEGREAIELAAKRPLANQLIRLGVMSVLLLAAPKADASRQDCRDAVDRFNETLGDVSTALRDYGNCVAHSRGHDDCSGEFSSLQAEHSDFEDAVSSYQAECD
jgi:hypothetical protein